MFMNPKFFEYAEGWTPNNHFCLSKLYPRLRKMKNLQDSIVSLMIFIFMIFMISIGVHLKSVHLSQDQMEETSSFQNEAGLPAVLATSAPHGASFSRGL